MNNLSHQEQEARLENLLNSHSNLSWKRNKAGRYPIHRKNEPRHKGALWLRITYGKECFVVTTTGDITSDMKNHISQIVGNCGQIASNTHIDWFDVEFEIIVSILDNFSTQ